MYALPTIVVSEGTANFTEGSLFRLPPELGTKYQIDWYVNRSKPGWNRCPQGYHVYVVDDVGGTRFIIPGLNIIGEARPNKKYYESPILFSKQQIVEFANSLTEESIRVEKAKDEGLRDLIHDLRALSSAIYNSAIAARDEYDIGQTASARDRIETVIATQTMLSIRIDLLDYLSSQIILTELERIEVFRKVDKVVRCFRPKANVRRINLTIRGPSFGATFGPAIFELIPYAIIDNAIKYAPRRSDVIVQVTDEPEQIAIKILSYGPLIDIPERTKIFEKGYRGVYASGLVTQGTGIGLYTAKELIERYFDGSLNVAQEMTPSIIDGRTYFPTEFEILVPRHKDGI